MSEIKKLAEKISLHQGFYDLGKSRISDEAFDKLVKKLKKLDPGNPVLLFVGTTPVGRVIKHRKPMLSLDKAYSYQDIGEWSVPIQHDFVVQPKYDGLAASVVYDENGELEYVSTRGDGVKGEDITRNARVIINIPQKIPYDAVEVRGEIVMRRSTFDKRYAKSFANPRNLVAGAMMRKQVDTTTLLDITFVAYDFIGGGSTYSEKMMHLSTAGFITAKTIVALSEDLQESIEEIKAARKAIDYELDGVVIKANRLADRQNLGDTSHHPRWAIAYKFQGDTGETTLQWVNWQVSRTGTITPVAIFDPVELSGASLQKATLHHLAQFIALDLHVGDRVLVTRRGGIIPHIEGVSKKSQSGGRVPEPSSCPSCGSATERRGDFLACTKPVRCPGVRVGKLGHWAGALEWDGWGSEVLAGVYSKGIIRTVLDFYRPDLYGQLERLDGFGATSAQKLCDEVWKTKEISLDALLRALGIESIGKVTAKKIMRHFKTVDALLEWTAESDANGVMFGGPALGSKTLTAFLIGIQENIDLIEAVLTKISLQPYKESDGVNTEAAGPFVGKAVVFTGPLSDMDREQARRLVRRLGGTTPDGLTKDVDLLVIGDGARDAQQGKRNKAKKYGVKMISEEEWAVLLSEALEANNAEVTLSE